jgi:flavin-dependent thymidylate synthase
MKVQLISVTPNALGLLLATKNTRLKFEEDPSTWSVEKQMEHLAYMRDTIKSSWEFVGYVFQIEGVTRAFTHQLVRTRNGSYAQESQRTVDASGNGFASLAGKPSEEQALHYRAAAEQCFLIYEQLMAGGIPAQDARGILPTSTLTSIVAKFSLRTLHEMAKVRLCVRTQGEYQEVFREMRARVIEIHPWVAENRFIEVACVSDGVCAFPRYGKKECKFYGTWMDRDAEKNALHTVFWASAKQVAVPVARGGKTM